MSHQGVRREAGPSRCARGTLGHENLSKPEIGSPTGVRGHPQRQNFGQNWPKYPPHALAGHTMATGQNVPQANQSTAETLPERHGVTARTIKRDGQFAQGVESLKEHVPDIEQRACGAHGSAWRHCER